MYEVVAETILERILQFKIKQSRLESIMEFNECFKFYSGKQYHFRIMPHNKYFIITDLKSKIHPKFGLSIEISDLDTVEKWLMGIEGKKELFRLQEGEFERVYSMVVNFHLDNSKMFLVGTQLWQ